MHRRSLLEEQDFNKKQEKRRRGEFTFLDYFENEELIYHLILTSYAVRKKKLRKIHAGFIEDHPALQVSINGIKWELYILLKRTIKRLKKAKNKENLGDCLKLETFLFEILEGGSRKKVQLLKSYLRDFLLKTQKRLNEEDEDL